MNASPLSRKQRRRLALVLTMMLNGSSMSDRQHAMANHKALIAAREAASRTRRREVHP